MRYPLPTPDERCFVRSAANLSADLYGLLIYDSAEIWSVCVEKLREGIGISMLSELFSFFLLLFAEASENDCTNTHLPLFLGLCNKFLEPLFGEIETLAP